MKLVKPTPEDRRLRNRVIEVVRSASRRLGAGDIGGVKAKLFTAVIMLLSTVRGSVHGPAKTPTDLTPN